jgi:hypothetical protein
LKFGTTIRQSALTIGRFKRKHSALAVIGYS